MTELPEWERLAKSLELEADRGYQNIQGSQYRFDEFLCLSFGKPPKYTPLSELRLWQSMAIQFAKYSELDLPSREQLIKEALLFLKKAQKSWEQKYLQNQVSSKIQVKESTASYEKKPISGLDTLLSTALGRHGKDLAKLNLFIIRDLLFYYPRDYIDYARLASIANLVVGESLTLVGEVKSCKCFTSPKNRKLTILEITIKDHSGQIRLSRFFAGNRYTNQKWQEMIKNQYIKGTIIAASGTVKNSSFGITLDNPELEVLGNPNESVELTKIGKIIPIYPLTEGITANQVRIAATRCLHTAQELVDPIPEKLRQQYQLIELSQAIANIHFPKNQQLLKAARHRLVFDEFFYLQLGFLQRRQQLRAIQSNMAIAPTGELINKFYELLPFKLTNAQQRVVNDILNDLVQSNSMNRLIQGDVGSGKTVVAVIAILAAIQSGYQAALMAPTEVLAEQHYRKIVTWFNQLYLPVELLTGSTKISKRRQIFSHLETGALKLIIGTHALIQDKVTFHRLGLVVIDEQHRFGVHQRARLLDKGADPHVLTMTATPIPRTLALTIHGDLDVSQIDELPPGRQAITTNVLTSKDRKEAYNLIEREIAKGRQAYIIFPLVEESEKIDVRAAVAEHEYLSETVFPNFKVGLLHGRMNPIEKEEIIQQFRDNQILILVSTTVVEVGVDVPNATVMLIENAERFGLSQLHQLRGRVGRGKDQSYCLLMTGTQGSDAIYRLNVLKESQDGFWISEMDMKLRGPGQVLGTRQSGLPDFSLASLATDQDVLLLARSAAEKVIAKDETLDRWPSLKAEMEIRYRKLLGGTILT